MLRFVEFHYTNALFLYKRIDGNGEKWRASGASFFWSMGVCMLGINVVQQFSGSLAPLVRGVISTVDKPYNNAAEYLLAVPFALVLNYCWLWKRTPLLEKRYAMLETKHDRWLVALGISLSLFFALACGYGRVNFWGSLALAGSIWMGQELLYLVLKK